MALALANREALGTQRRQSFLKLALVSLTSARSSAMRPYGVWLHDEAASGDANCVVVVRVEVFVFEVDEW